LETTLLKPVFERYLQNKCSVAEVKWLLDHFDTDDETELLSLIMEKFDLNADESVDTQNPDQQVLNQVYARIKQQIHPVVPVKKTIKPLWPRFVAAASVVLVVGLGIYFYTTQGTAPKAGFSLGAAKDIPPGKSAATLTLANGEVIQLSQAKNGVVINAKALVYDDGTEVGRTQAVTGVQTIATPRGGVYQVILPDGTKVWLNAASSLRFPSTFQGLASRKVDLVGEAYFEVSKNKVQPFVVSTAKQAVTVLGTHFLISSYPDESVTKTTLLEGAVKVSSGAEEKILVPGQQSVLNSNQLTIQPADVEEVMAWKNGDFVFKSEDLEGILKQVARWYDVELVYAADAPKKVILWGYVSRSNHISAVLNQLERTGKVHFKMEGKKIMIMK
jgi:transmembrane sensor